MRGLIHNNAHLYCDRFMAQKSLKDFYPVRRRLHQVPPKQVPLVLNEPEASTSEAGERRRRPVKRKLLELYDQLGAPREQGVQLRGSGKLIKSDLPSSQAKALVR